MVICQIPFLGYREDVVMGNRRGQNKFMADICGASALPVNYVPSKKDLFDILKNLHYKSPPEVSRARAIFNEATEARRTFERKNRIWRQLRRAERRAERELQEIQGLEREKWEDEIAECRDMLRLHGVTSALVDRIEKLRYGDEEE